MASSSSDKHASRRVRDFLQPPPTVSPLKTREMQQVIGLFLLLGVLGAFFAMFADKTPNVLKKIFPEKKAAAQTQPSALAEQELQEAAQMRRAALRALFEEAVDVADNEDFTESKGYSRIARELAVVPADEMTRAVEGILDPKAAAADPKAHRGRVYRLRGRLALNPVKLWHSGEIKEIYRGGLYDGEQRFVVDAVLHPGWQVGRDEVVDIEGVFYRMVRYEQQDGRISKPLPYLLVRNVRRLAGTSRESSPLVVASYVGVLALVTTAMVIYMIRRRPSRPAGAPTTPVGFHQMFQNKLREERRKDSGH